MTDHWSTQPAGLRRGMEPDVLAAVFATGKAMSDALRAPGAWLGEYSVDDVVHITGEFRNGRGSGIPCTRVQLAFWGSAGLEDDDPTILAQVLRLTPAAVCDAYQNEHGGLEWVDARSELPEDQTAGGARDGEAAGVVRFRPTYLAPYFMLHAWTGVAAITRTRRTAIVLGHRPSPDLVERVSRGNRFLVTCSRHVFPNTRVRDQPY